jgi:hypothetical protein
MSLTSLKIYSCRNTSFQNYYTLKGWKSKRKDLGNMKKNTLTVKQCAKRVEKTESAVRIGLQRGGYKFGTAIQTVPPTPSRPRGGWDYHIPAMAVEHYMNYGNFPVIIVNGDDVTKLIHSLANNIAMEMIKEGGIGNDNKN